MTLLPIHLYSTLIDYMILPHSYCIIFYYIENVSNYIFNSRLFCCCSDATLTLYYVHAKPAKLYKGEAFKNLSEKVMKLAVMMKVMIIFNVYIIQLIIIRIGRSRYMHNVKVGEWGKKFYDNSVCFTK